MQDRRAQAQKILQVYHRRTLEVTKLLREGNIEKAQEGLMLRNAAFYNFKALDDLARREGIVLDGDQALVQIWKQVRIDDATLRSELKRASDLLREQLVQMANYKSTIGKFHSGAAGDLKIRNMV